jgi:hypothetical protein
MFYDIIFQLFFKKGVETEIGNVGDHQATDSLTLLCSLS